MQPDLRQAKQKNSSCAQCCILLSRNSCTLVGTGLRCIIPASLQRALLFVGTGVSLHQGLSIILGSPGLVPIIPQFISTEKLLSSVGLCTPLSSSPRAALPSPPLLVAMDATAVTAMMSEDIIHGQAVVDQRFQQQDDVTQVIREFGGSCGHHNPSPCVDRQQVDPCLGSSKEIQNVLFREHNHGGHEVHTWQQILWQHILTRARPVFEVNYIYTPATNAPSVRYHPKSKAHNIHQTVWVNPHPESLLVSSFLPRWRHEYNLRNIRTTSISNPQQPPQHVSHTTHPLLRGIVPLPRPRRALRAHRLVLLLRGVIRLSRRGRSVRAVRLLLVVMGRVGEGSILLRLLLRAKLVVCGRLLMRAEFGVWLLGLLLLLLGRVGGCLLSVGCGAWGWGRLRIRLGLRLRLRRVHLRVVLLLVGVLGLSGLGPCLGGQHRRALRLLLDGCVVGGGLLVLLVPEAVGVAVEDEGRDEEKPG